MEGKNTNNIRNHLKMNNDEITPEIMDVLQASTSLVMQIKSPEKLRELFVAFCGVAAVRPDCSVMEWLDATQTNFRQQGILQ